MLQLPKTLHPLAACTGDHPLLQALMQAGACSQIEIDRNGEVYSATAQFHSLIGMSKTEKGVVNLSKALADDQWKLLKKTIERVLRTAEPQVKTIELNVPSLGDSPTSYWALISHPYPWSGKTSACVTNRKSDRLQVWLFAQQSDPSFSSTEIQNHRLCAIGAIASGVSHDLNNLFTSAMTFTHLIQQKTTNDYQKSHLHLLEKTLQKATHLTTELLNFVKEDESDTIPINPLTCIRDITQMLGRTLPKRIQINLSTPSRAHPILLRHGELCQIVLNLLVNARDAISENGEIDVQASFSPPKNPHTFILNVTDNGSGVEESEIEKVFDPFYTTKPDGKGTGLGLSIIKKIINDNQGTITFSSSPGEYTRFTVTLPVVQN